MRVVIDNHRARRLLLCVVAIALVGVVGQPAFAQVTFVFTGRAEVNEAQAEPAPPADAGEQLQKISRKLLAAADIQADKTPLSKFVDEVAKKYEIPLRVDEKSLQAAGVPLDAPITASFKKGTLGQALTKALKERNLQWELRETEVVITAVAKVAKAEPVREGGPVAEKAPAAPAPKVDPEMLQKISRKLLAAADVQADKTQLSTLIADLSKKYEIPLRVDSKAIQAAGLAVDPAITASIKKGTLGQALTALLKERNLRWELRDTEVVITAGAVPAKPAPQAAARVARAAPAAGAVPVQQLQQFVPQFRVVWKAELHFIRNVCQPSDDQLAKLQAGSVEKIAAASAQFVQGRGGVRRVVNGAVVATPTSTEPRTILQEAIQPLLEANLTPDQLSRYKNEVDQARLSRRAMAIDVLVCKLDRDLQLSGPQRDKLLESLATNLDGAWCMPPQALMNLEQQFMPAIPDKLVLPHLNERQQKLWSSAQKQNVQNFFGGFGLFGNEIDESVWDEADAKEPAGVIQAPGNPPQP